MHTDTTPSPARSIVADAGATHDLIVIGAGGAGMAAALFGAIRGLKVLLLERTEFVGGTTAFSAGTVWIPNTPHAVTVGARDSVAQAATYLDQVVGDHADRRLREAFLRQGPQALATLERESHVKLRPYALHPDYESDLDGATLRGRAMEPLPFDGRQLGAHFALLRAPIPEFTVLGGMMVDRTDVNHLLAMTKRWASFKHAARLVLRQARDRLTHPRGTRLVMGNALCARLLQSLVERGVEIRTEAQVERLVTEGGRVTGIVLMHKGQRQALHARAGVVLASGGFNRHPQLRAQLLPAAANYTPGAPGHTGEAITLALGAGAQIGDRNLQNAFWAPVSVRRRADGSTAVFPHFVLDRAKPGTVVVNQAGQRFVNESTSYHRFGAAMLAEHARSACIPAYLIADARALKTYGLGMVRPGGMGLAGALKDGYVVSGQTLAELAGRLGVPAAALAQTVARFNQHAARGEDPDFQRGRTAYQRNIGDAAAGGINPNLGALQQAPYYAVKLYPGDIGASAGLVTDAQARVLGANQQPIDGLYAVGNDMNSIMGGTYPGPGITIGPALVFAHIAAADAAGRLAGEALAA
ncbi:fumarate reductase/succinate dehydrogenase flavoprotein domain protein [Leptothrix cholodnii SP-6]|uniref:Fumarate reductase/succinate dehydrogenase flavoprotein domain protein n=1 Tax=Leptothrix cholodnii (strain ATCC 51168 / LMG 8142 / SP-6) TaxID=395495 RepID=B1Y541_LEPCP|nr:FAD-dependent oxidoreductase [Leptothrix cholodnii]ACB35937.1 fumarate reductase/succinate dehydrogenase flavoprotein domain protein [Leptothrix cholodnii SP-6]